MSEKFNRNRARTRDAKIAGAKAALEGKTEMDAVIAYLQMTGTLVDFSTYEADDLSNRR